MGHMIPWPLYQEGLESIFSHNQSGINKRERELEMNIVLANPHGPPGMYDSHPHDITKDTEPWTG